ncbi:secreted RxLR effector protein 161-like [Hevea brasiliensis]|uniref:secreted RxLR effector protein 161-like n=1 Tax=Hevea brasiliensis TaxID=3981 RepID=UPI0025E15139|nr:secreted RxLR effector protein 161-like [Hevea brasiliensis]
MRCKILINKRMHLRNIAEMVDMHEPNNYREVISYSDADQWVCDMSPKINEEMELMSSVPYSSAICNIMYAMGTTDVGLTFDRAKMNDSVVGYVDSDFTRNLDKRRSLIGYLFTISGSAINWKATLQATVALSTIEAEYTTLAKVVKEA